MPNRSPQLSPPAALALALLALLASSTASAHPGHAEAGWLAGFVHPFSGLDHLLALLAMGWCCAARTGRQRLLWPPSFALAQLAGAVAALRLGLAPAALELQLALSLPLLAVLLLWPSDSGRLAAALIAGLALLHGTAHGQELTGPALPWLAGMFGASLLLQGAGLLAGHLLRGRPGATGGAAVLLGAAATALLAGLPA